MNWPSGAVISLYVLTLSMTYVYASCTSANSQCTDQMVFGITSKNGNIAALSQLSVNSMHGTQMHCVCSQLMAEQILFQISPEQLYFFYFRIWRTFILRVVSRARPVYTKHQRLQNGLQPHSRATLCVSIVFNRTAIISVVAALTRRWHWLSL